MAASEAERRLEASPAHPSPTHALHTGPISHGENGVDQTEKQNHETKPEPQILDWDGPNDPGNPQNYSPVRKWLIAGTALFSTLIVPLNGTGIAIAVHEINAEFNISDANFPNSYWSITSWSIGGAIFIIIFLPLLEDVGVRNGYLVFYLFFLIMIIPQALAQNYATLIVTRFFSGGCVALLANTISSTIPDLWEDDRGRTLPVGIYILFYTAGATLGPPVFGGVVQHIGNWRWIFYIQLIIYGALFPLFIFMIKETRATVILRRRAKKLRKDTGKPIYAPTELQQTNILRTIAQSAYRPLFLVFTEPVLAASSIWSAFAFGTVFMFTQSVEVVFVETYGWEVYSTGYVLAAVVIGEVIGWVISLVGIRPYFQSAERNDEAPGRPIPEARLYVSIFGSFIGMSGGMFVYGWTSYPHIHWIAPAIGLAMVGAGIQITISAVADYVVDAYAASNYAASAISAVAALENVVAGLLPLATMNMYDTLGFQWASSTLGFVALMLSFIPVVLVWKGRLLRERSPFMLSGGESGIQPIKK